MTRIKSYDRIKIKKVLTAGKNDVTRFAHTKARHHISDRGVQDALAAKERIALPAIRGERCPIADRDEDLVVLCEIGVRDWVVRHNAVALSVAALSICSTRSISAFAKQARACGETIGEERRAW